MDREENKKTKPYGCPFRHFFVSLLHILQQKVPRVPNLKFAHGPALENPALTENRSPSFFKHLRNRAEEKVGRGKWDVKDRKREEIKLKNLVK